MAQSQPTQDGSTADLDGSGHLDDRGLGVLALLADAAFVIAVQPDEAATDRFHFVFANDAFRDIVGWPTGEPVTGELPAGPADAAVATYAEHFELAARDQRPVSFETDVGGGRTTIAINVSPVLDGVTCTHLVCSAHDVTERRRIEASLAYHTRHDPLTNLPNRVLLVERLREALEPARASGGEVALLFLDIDDFKLVNDSLGHDAGDALLTLVARRLERVIRSGDVVARFGGDEFAIVCHDLGSLEEARAVAERVHRLFEQPIALDIGNVFLTASIGIVLSDGTDDHAERMLRDADIAMFAAKTDGRGTMHEFDDSMRVRVVARLELEGALRGALERNQFRIHYQPLVRFDESEVIGFEALLRWQHPERGLLAPPDFLEAAEAMGLLVPIGAWVLAEACHQAARWSAESTFESGLTVSVNLSERQLMAPDLVQTVEQALASSGLEPRLLVLEITERVLMDDRDRTVAVLEQLARIGVQLCIDDFGTGQSSLAYLKHLPVNSLKIDPSFIDGLGTDQDDAAIVAALVALGHALGLTVTAEGIETPRQLSEVRSLGCDTGQGYYFARPQPGEIVRALVHRRFRWRQRDPAA